MTEIILSARWNLKKAQNECYYVKVIAQQLIVFIGWCSRYDAGLFRVLMRRVVWCWWWGQVHSLHHHHHHHQQQQHHSCCRQAGRQCAGPGTSPSPAGSPVLSSVSFTDLVVWGLRHLKTTDYTFKNHKLLNLWFCSSSRESLNHSMVGNKIKNGGRREAWILHSRRKTPCFLCVCVFF